MQRLAFLGLSDLAAASTACQVVLSRHEVVALPTETFYGLAVRPDDQEAVEALLVLKGRPADKALPLVAADLDSVESLVVVPALWRERLARVWPAPLSVVLPVRRPLAACGETAAVRVSAHPLLRRLLVAVGPLTATSANPSGAPPPTSAEAVAAFFPHGLGVLLDGGQAAGGQPSTLVDLTCDPPKLLRPGAFSLDPGWRVKSA